MKNKTDHHNEQMVGLIMEMKIISIYLTQNKHCLECLNGMNKINIHDSTTKIHTCIFRLCSKYPVITRDN